MCSETDPKSILFLTWEISFWCSIYYVLATLALPQQVLETISKTSPQKVYRNKATVATNDRQCAKWSPKWLPKYIPNSLKICPWGPHPPNGAPKWSFLGSRCPTEAQIDQKCIKNRTQILSLWPACIKWHPKIVIFTYMYIYIYAYKKYTYMHIMCYRTYMYNIRLGHRIVAIFIYTLYIYIYIRHRAFRHLCVCWAQLIIDYYWLLITYWLLLITF